ncbi:MAG: hypothetical protein IKN16_10800 [Selenomonadaceae bacterium]|nr:hypothetical protein [Selenomonadaceae bacterium]
MPRRIFFGVGGEKIIVAENKIFLLQSAGIFFAALIFLWSWRRKIIVAENKIFPVTIGGDFFCRADFSLELAAKNYRG